MKRWLKRKAKQFLCEHEFVLYRKTYYNTYHICTKCDKVKCVGTTWPGIS